MGNIDRNTIRVKTTLETEAERNAQEYFIKMASEHTDECLEKYCGLKMSHNGRYICSDLVKEIFDIYNESRATRNLFASAVHNSAACLANEQFQRMARNEEITDCYFFTGSPGAGKSFLIECLYQVGMLPQNIVVYEGDLTVLDTIKQKIEVMHANGKEVHIVVLDAEPELALANVAKRRTEIGRGASKNTIARILSKLPESLMYLSQIYPFLIIEIHKNQNNEKIVSLNEIDEINHGTYDEIYKRLSDFESGETPKAITIIPPKNNNFGK